MKDLFPKEKNPQLATFSVDWEDFGQLFCRYEFRKIVPPLEDISRQTDIILELLDETGVKATFFILGILAEYKPDLVKKIYRKGHEIGLHGYSHIPFNALSKEEILEEMIASINIVSDTIGGKVYGFRAPVFSIHRGNLFVLEMLADLGIEYDSSIFPVKLPRYGIPGFPDSDCMFCLPNGKKIIEFPQTYLKLWNLKVPFAGGGYMRLLPLFLLKTFFRKVHQEKHRFTIYLHPYEFDSKSIDVAANSPVDVSYSVLKRKFLNLKWNLFRDTIPHKARWLLSNYEFITFRERMHYVKDTNCTGILG
jgi:peptidoglycan-N-acetylglucosamine deacetylase